MTKLSVVLAVYNGEAHVAATLDGILAQTERDFELLAVDDGSTDRTLAILNAYAQRDPRVRVLTQPNAGLTRSLIRGCAEARGTFIARHDNGDVSHPERFARQLAALADPEVVLVSCLVRFRAPGGERLYDVDADGDALRHGLLHAGAADIRSVPHHGSAMFRRDAYLRAGGYRDAFRYAQDLDLWIRLASLGRIVIVPEVLYEATIDVRTISATARRQQLELTGLAVRLRDAAPGEREALLERARALEAASPGGRAAEAGTLYFIASCLLRNADRAWRRYAREALRRDPLHWRTWTLLPRALWRRVRN